jgi:hypothetical protein
MTGTQIFNHVYYAVLSVLTGLSTLPVEIVDVLPAKWKPWVAGASLLAMWLRSQRNLMINPDGSTARAAWTPDNAKAKTTGTFPPA